jgi:23S rRNA pseudouridine2605 synthase
MERLQKILAHAGVASRRKAEELIANGRVRVNGVTISALGSKVDPQRDRIQVDGKVIQIERQVYVILHKPKGYLSDVDEGRGKPLALDLVTSSERLYAAGRLDASSEGLLLLTNDGELAHRITHPKFEHEKEYLVLVEGEPSADLLQRARKGIWHDGYILRADRISRAERRQKYGVAARGWSWVKIVLHEGKKRQVRHMFAAIGHPVIRLIRSRIGAIELGSLPVGHWRALNESEIRELSKKPTRIKVDSIHHRD